MKVSRAKTEHKCLNGTPLGSVEMQSAQLPQVTGFKYMGSTLQSNGDMNIEVNKRTQCGWHNCRKMSGASYAISEYPQDDRSASYAVRDHYLLREGTVSDRNGDDLCRWACGHILRYHVRNDNFRERLKVENITEKQDWSGLDT